MLGWVGELLDSHRECFWSVQELNEPKVGMS